MRRRPWLLLFLLAVARAEEEESVREVPNPFEGSQLTAPKDASVSATRVLDAATMRPVPGARLWMEGEPSHSLPRLPDPWMVVLAGEDGWAFLPEHGGWSYVEAEGYAPSVEIGGPLEITYLHRARDVEFRILDWRGDPAAGAWASHFLGCGHTPDSRQTTVDAEGRTVLRDVNPDEGYLWVVGENIEAWEHWLRDWAGNWETPLVIGRPGMTVEGRILAHDGSPMEGAFVGPGIWHHGPWTRTDADGKFRLAGVEPFEWIRVDRWEHEYGSVGLHAPPPGVPVEWRWPGPPPDSRRRIELELVGTDGEPVQGRVRVYAWRAEDGFTAVEEPEHGTALLDLPPGEYTLVADGLLGAYGRVETDLRVVEGGSLSLTMPRNPMLRVDASRVTGRVLLCSAEYARDVTEEAQAGAIFAPEDVELTLHVTWAGDEGGEVIEVPRTGRGEATPPLVLPGPPPTEVVLSIAGPDGAPARATLVDENGAERGPASAFRFEKLRPFGEQFRVVPEDSDLRERDLVVPAKPGGTIDLGPIVLRPANEPPVRVAWPDGTPATAFVSGRRTAAAASRSTKTSPGPPTRSRAKATPSSCRPSPPTTTVFANTRANPCG